MGKADVERGECRAAGMIGQVCRRHPEGCIFEDQLGLPYDTTTDKAVTRAIKDVKQTRKLIRQGGCRKERELEIKAEQRLAELSSRFSLGGRIKYSIQTIFQRREK